jgi:FkbH-like protein
MQVRLLDRFGDNGMISAIICRPQGKEWLIDTWVMSCRVLGREVEQIVLNRLAEEANARSISRLIGVYRPTERNSMVAEHYRKLGFACLQQGDGNRWMLNLDEFTPHNAPISIKIDGGAF